MSALENLLAKSIKNYTPLEAAIVFLLWRDHFEDAENAAADYEKLVSDYTATVKANAELASLIADLQWALEKISKGGVVFDAKGTWSKEVNEIANVALAKIKKV